MPDVLMAPGLSTNELNSRTFAPISEQMSTCGKEKE